MYLSKCYPGRNMQCRHCLSSPAKINKQQQQKIKPPLDKVANPNPDKTSIIAGVDLVSM